MTLLSGMASIVHLQDRQINAFPARCDDKGVPVALASQVLSRLGNRPCFALDAWKLRYTFLTLDASI